jgi:hypothetical protein
LDFETRGDAAMSSRTLVMLGMAAVLVSVGCNRHEESDFSSPTGPSHYYEEAIDEDLYVVLREDGAYYAGIRRRGESAEFPDEPCRWIPWPLQQGETFPTCLNWSAGATVYSVGGTLQVPAGVFDNVSEIQTTGDPFISYWFRPGTWILEQFHSDLRGGLEMELSSYALRLSGSTLRDRYGLGPGSRYVYEFDGSDSLGLPYGGSVTATVTGETELLRERAIVIHRTGTLWIDDPRPVGVAGTIAVTRSGYRETRLVR